MIHKLYCYVDESGQDTRGALFVVAAVVAAEDRERVRGDAPTGPVEPRR